METQRQLIIGGTLFDIDYQNKEFIEVNNRQNRISFDKLSESDGFYEGLYHMIDKNCLSRNVLVGDVYFDEEVTEIRIPKRIMDNDYPDQNTARAINDESYLNDYGVLEMDDRIANRLQGMLPRIDIAGDTFIVDWRLQELRHEHDLSSIINLKFLPVSSDGNSYLSYYHVVSKQTVQPDPDIREMPPHVVMIEIPREMTLDPVGVARQYGLKDTQLLRTYPIRDNLKPTVKSLSETPLKELVEKIKSKDSRGDIKKAGDVNYN